MQHQLPWHYLCLWQIGLPLWLPVCYALTLNSLAGRLPVSVSSRDTRRLGSHEGYSESTCQCQWEVTKGPWNRKPLLHLLKALQRNETKLEHSITRWYSHNLMPGLDVGSQYLEYDINQWYNQGKVNKTST